MTSIRLTDEQWAKLRDFLSQEPNAYLSNEAKSRQFVEAVIWVSRSGAQWLLLPSECGGFSSKIHVTVDGLGNPLRFRIHKPKSSGNTINGAIASDTWWAVWGIAKKSSNLSTLWQSSGGRLCVSIGIVALNNPPG